MKVMGSAVMLFQAIVIGLAMPVAIVIDNHDKSTVIWVGMTLFVICFLAVGGIRRDRRTAIMTGSIVQLLVVVAGLYVRPFLVPAVIFTLCWILAIKLSEKTDNKIPVD